MKTTYNDIEISYVEGDNRWHFELRGRSRSAESLAKAKEAIDKEPIEKRKQKFPRFDAYFFQYGENPIIVTVTGVSEEYYRASPQFWITNEGKRSKEHVSSLYPVNAENGAIVNEIISIKKQADQLEKARVAQMAKLEVATIPKEIAE